VIALPALALAAAIGTPGPGEVVERVACRESPEQSYALYLPSAYTAARPWPVLYLLDARGRALLPIERFRAAAEELGWILASSYNSRSDTKDDPNSPAMRAMWKDTHATLALDERRVYVSGFSGGARAAAGMALALPKAFAGVIGCGAGFPDDTAPVRQAPPFLYFGAAGDRDFNYYEMRALDEKLRAVKAPHRIVFFDGAHDWPPAPVVRQALVWMELAAMRVGARPKDKASIASFYGEALSAARAAEAAGRAVDAAQLYAGAEEDFRGLADTAEAAAAAARLSESSEVRRALRQARSRDERDRAMLSRLAGILRRAAGEPDIPAPGLVAAQLGVPTLRKKAQTDASPEERLSAERILANLRVQTSFYLPQQMLEKRELARARMLLSVAGEIDPKDPSVDYKLAAAAARLGEAALAVRDLDRALAKGLRGVELVEKDSDFDSIRAAPAFRSWVARAAATSPAP
jgi:predicted esterase